MLEPKEDRSEKPERLERLDAAASAGAADMEREAAIIAAHTPLRSLSMRGIIR